MNPRQFFVITDGLVILFALKGQVRQTRERVSIIRIALQNPGVFPNGFGCSLSFFVGGGKIEADHRFVGRQGRGLLQMLHFLLRFTLRGVRRGQIGMRRRVFRMDGQNARIALDRLCVLPAPQMHIAHRQPGRGGIGRMADDEAVLFNRRVVPVGLLEGLGQQKPHRIIFRIHFDGPGVAFHRLVPQIFAPVGGAEHRLGFGILCLDPRQPGQKIDGAVVLAEPHADAGQFLHRRDIAGADSQNLFIHFRGFPDAVLLKIDACQNFAHPRIFSVPGSHLLQVLLLFARIAAALCEPQPILGGKDHPDRHNGDFVPRGIDNDLINARGLSPFRNFSAGEKVVHQINPAKEDAEGIALAASPLQKHRHGFSA